MLMEGFSFGIRGVGSLSVWGYRLRGDGVWLIGGVEGERDGDSL